MPALSITVMVALAYLAPLDTAASLHNDVGLKPALVSFAAARTLNAIISIV